MMSTVIIHMPKYEAKSRQAKPAHTYVNGKVSQGSDASVLP